MSFISRPHRLWPADQTEGGRWLTFQAKDAALFLAAV